MNNRPLPVYIGAPGQQPSRVSEAIAPLLLQALMYADRKIFETVNHPFQQLIESRTLSTVAAVLVMFGALYLLQEMVRMVMAGQSLWPKFAYESNPQQQPARDNPDRARRVVKSPGDR